LVSLQAEEHEEGPNKSGHEKNLLFGGTPIEQDEPELSASFYAEQNPANQAQPHPYQSFVFGDYQSPVTFDIIPDPVGPIITGDQTKIRQFLQDCLGYLDMNQNIYNTDQLKIGFILSYMNGSKAANWKEYYVFRYS
jgi:hypothetical protein